MPEAKTKPTAASVAAHIAAIDDPARRADCSALVALMKRVTKQDPVMWGPSIIGFGRYQYRYESGHSGECCAVGFASRKGDISLYVGAQGVAQQALLPRLGRHKTGKGCVYIKRLADVDRDVLEALVAAAYADIKARWPDE